MDAPERRPKVIILVSVPGYANAKILYKKFEKSSRDARKSVAVSVRR